MEEVEKVLQRIGTLENRVDCLIQKEEDLLAINKSIIQKLKNVKEIISTTILNIKTNIIDSIHYKQTKEEHPNCKSLIQDQARSYGIIGGVFSAFECYVNKFEKDPKKHTHIFNAYNNFNCGTTKTTEQLKDQIIAQLEILNTSYQLYIFQYKKYDFPKNLGAEQMKKLLNDWALKVPNEDQKYYKAAFNIISGNPHVSYADELGNDSRINPKFLENAVALIHQANQVGVEALNKYKQTGKSPSLNLYEDKLKEKLKKAAEQEKKRQQERKELDKLFVGITKDLKELITKPKQKLDKSPIEKKIYNFSQELFSFRNDWEVYWFQENKTAHQKQLKELIGICNTLIKMGYDKVFFSALMNDLEENSQK